MKNYNISITFFILFYSFIQEKRYNINIQKCINFNHIFMVKYIDILTYIVQLERKKIVVARAGFINR